jgi:hypothetical protein
MYIVNILLVLYNILSPIFIKIINYLDIHILS